MESNRLDSAFSAPPAHDPRCPRKPWYPGSSPNSRFPSLPGRNQGADDETKPRVGSACGDAPRQHHHMTKKTRNNISTTSETLEILGNNTPLPGRPRNFMIAVVVAIPNISIHPLSPATPPKPPACVGHIVSPDSPSLSMCVCVTHATGDPAPARPVARK